MRPIIHRSSYFRLCPLSKIIFNLMLRRLNAPMIDQVCFFHSVERPNLSQNVFLESKLGGDKNKGSGHYSYPTKIVPRFCLKGIRIGRHKKRPGTLTEVHFTWVGCPVYVSPGTRSVRLAHTYEHGLASIPQ